MRSTLLRSILFTLALIAASATAQDRPFLFTLAPRESDASPLAAHYDAAFGRETFEPFGGDNFEQTLGIQTDLGRSITFFGHVGVTYSDHPSGYSQQAEVLAQVANGEHQFMTVSAGAGLRHEYSGTSVLLGRALFGKEFRSWQLYGNLLLEKAFSSDRDEIDLIPTAGVSYRLSSTLQLGLESVGQDIEGLWDENEAEGGAILYVGPVVSIHSPSSAWGVTFGGGEILRLSRSVRTSDASRDLPPGKQNGFVIRSVISFPL